MRDISRERINCFRRHVPKLWYDCGDKLVCHTKRTKIQLPSRVLTRKLRPDPRQGIGSREYNRFSKAFAKWKACFIFSEMCATMCTPFNSRFGLVAYFDQFHWTRRGFIGVGDHVNGLHHFFDGSSHWATSNIRQFLLQHSIVVWERRWSCDRTHTCSCEQLQYNYVHTSLLTFQINMYLPRPLWWWWTLPKAPILSLLLEDGLWWPDMIWIQRILRVVVKSRIQENKRKFRCKYLQYY